jgi:hypothetical protein
MLLWGMFLFIVAGLCGVLAGPRPVAYMPESKTFCSLLVLEASSMARFLALGAMGVGVVGLLFFPTKT